MFGGPGGGELVAHGNLWEGQFVWVLEVCLIWEAHGQGLARSRGTLSNRAAPT